MRASCDDGRVQEIRCLEISHRGFNGQPLGLPPSRLGQRRVVATLDFPFVVGQRPAVSQQTDSHLPPPFDRDRVLLEGSITM